ncbi:hypothetical protein NMG60_11036027 [Bertholletia excelsa]
MDIMWEIISRLPVSSLLRFKLVCKTWYAWITDPRFISKHLHHYNSNKHHIIIKSFTTPINTDYITLYTDETSRRLVSLHAPFLVSKHTPVGSCNGLICLFRSCRYGSPICPWNPATREFRILPNYRQATRRSIWRSHTLGFGFDPASGDYKVVVRFWRQSSPLMILPFEFWCMVTRYRISTSMPVITEGILHWVAQYFSSPTECFAVVVYFDLRDEKFGQISMPNLDESVSYMRLIEFKGCLSLCAETSDLRPDKGDIQFNIWMKDKLDDSWTKKLSIGPSPTFPIPIGNYGNSLVVMETDGGHHKLFLHDPHAHEQRRKLPIPDVSYVCWYEIFSYMESLVPIKRRYKEEMEMIQKQISDGSIDSIIAGMELL